MKTASTLRNIAFLTFALALGACTPAEPAAPDGAEGSLEAPDSGSAAATTDPAVAEVADAPVDTPTPAAPVIGCDAFTEDKTNLQIAMADVIKAIDDGCLKGQIQFIDARSQLDYESGHIPGAIDVPFHSPKAHFAALPTDKWLISYCECPNSEALQVANALVNDGGFTKVKYITEGLAAWRDHGRELVEGPEAGVGDY